MLSSTYASTTRAKISDDHTQNVSAYDPLGFESMKDHGTSHIETVDVNGMALSLTTTINKYFGSRVMVPETGVIMNNHMNGIFQLFLLPPFTSYLLLYIRRCLPFNFKNTDFSIPNISNSFGYYPCPANYIQPRKRALSSVTPIIVDFANGTLYAVLGASGGSRMITATIQTVVNVLKRNMTAHQAIAQPRLHDQLIPNVVTFEYDFDNDTVDFMKERGHNVTWVRPGFSVAHALRVLPNGDFEAAGEPRQQGSAGLTA